MIFECAKDLLLQRFDSALLIMLIRWVFHCQVNQSFIHNKESNNFLANFEETSLTIWKPSFPLHLAEEGMKNYKHLQYLRNHNFDLFFSYNCLQNMKVCSPHTNVLPITQTLFPTQKRRYF